MKETYEKAIKPMLPKHFDENEWFVLVISVLAIICIYYITVKGRTLLWSQIIGISLLNLQLTTLGDYFLAMPPYDFYDTLDRNSGELFDILLQNIVYPGTILWFMHLYNRYTPRKVIFIFLSVGLLTVFEVIAVQYFHLYTYKSWKLYYSMVFYLFVMIINLYFFEKLTTFLGMRINAMDL